MTQYDSIYRKQLSDGLLISASLKWQETGIIVAPRIHDPKDIDGRLELEKSKQLGSG
jgi:hypothetical protein